jgi:hypothetical protein
MFKEGRPHPRLLWASSSLPRSMTDPKLVAMFMKEAHPLGPRLRPSTAATAKSFDFQRR